MSPATALFRLRNVHPPYVDDQELAVLHEMLQGPAASDLKAALAILDEAQASPSIDAFRKRFLALALEAYRREEISRAKLGEISSMIGLESGLKISGMTN